MKARDRVLTALGCNIRQKRQKHKLSQEALAEKSGLHRTYISDVECGKRNLSIYTLICIAAALDSTITDLVGGIDG